MRRCFQLAGYGLGHTWPNPLVGCVIVAGDRIIGEGFHKKAGLPHAEVEAIRSVRDTSLLSQSTVYVNLEPCAHHGRTPPCADLLVKSGVKRVVIAHTDPFPDVSGRGVEILRTAGIEVVSDICAQEARWLNRRFLGHHERRRPWVVLKWAQTADGFMDRERSKGETGTFAISGAASSRLVHRWRSEEQAILVGTRTALIDNPKLTVRHVAGPQPIRCAIDRKGILPETFHPFNTEGSGMRLRGSDPQQWLNELHEAGIQSVLIEGGALTHRLFLKSGLWDEARVIHAPFTIGRGLPAPVIPSPAVRRERIGDDLVYFYFHE